MKKKIILISLVLITPSCFFQQDKITDLVRNEIKISESAKTKDSNTSLNNKEQKFEENKYNDDIKTSSTPNLTASTTPSNITIERSTNVGGGGGSVGGSGVKPISTNIIGQIKEDEPIISTPIPSTSGDVSYSSNTGSQISGQVKK